MEEIPYILELIIPFCPPRIDNIFRLSMHKRNREIKEQYGVISRLIIGKKPNSPLKKATISILRYSDRFMDYDNTVSSYKCFIDAMVLAGVLEDDSFKITGKWNVDQVFLPRKAGKPYSYLKIEGMQSSTKNPRRLSSRPPLNDLPL